MSIPDPLKPKQTEKVWVHVLEFDDKRKIVTGLAGTTSTVIPQKKGELLKAQWVVRDHCFKKLDIPVGMQHLN